MEALPVERQIFELKDEFIDESVAFKRNRSPIERQMALNHINALLDAYLEIIPITQLAEGYDGA